MAREPANKTRQQSAKDTEKSLLNRREYIRLGAATTAVGTLSTGNVIAENPDQSDFNTRLNAIDDLGMDPTGTEAIDTLLADVPADSVVEFPEGDYLVTADFATNATKFVGIRKQEQSADVTFVIAPAGEEVTDTIDALDTADTDASDASFEADDAAAAVDSDASLLVCRDDCFEMHDVRLADFELGSASARDGASKTMTIQGPNDGIANYRLTVSDSIEAHPDDGTQRATRPSATSVEDALGDTTHKYTYTGDIAELNVDGEATVSVDGQQVDPERLSESDRPNLLVADARENEESYTLRFEGATDEQTPLAEAPTLTTQ